LADLSDPFLVAVTQTWVWQVLVKENNRPLAKVNDAIKMRYEKIKGKSPLEWKL